MCNCHRKSEQKNKILKEEQGKQKHYDNSPIFYWLIKYNLHQQVANPICERKT